MWNSDGISSSRTRPSRTTSQDASTSWGCAAGSELSHVDAQSGSTPAVTPAVGRYRWRICALLFAATTLNYVDRQVLGVLAPDLTAQFGWSEIQYGDIVVAFQLAYAVGLLGAGALIDKLGTRIGYALAICMWSLAAMSHALAGSAFGFADRAILSRASAKPAISRRPSRRLPSGFRRGSARSPRASSIPAPTLARSSRRSPCRSSRCTWGWQAAFLFTGVLSAAWLVTWLMVYRPPDQHPSLSSSGARFHSQRRC